LLQSSLDSGRKRGSPSSRSNSSEYVGDASDLAASESHEGITPVDMRVVSLARRHDRWRKFVARNSAVGLVEGQDFERFDAVDGRSLSVTDPRLPRYFKPLPTPNSSLAPSTTASPGQQDAMVEVSKPSGRPDSTVALSDSETTDIWETVLQRSPGVVGCGLSHVALWEELVSSYKQIQESTKSNRSYNNNSVHGDSIKNCSVDWIGTKAGCRGNETSSSDKDVKKLRGGHLLVVLEDDAEVLCSREVWTSLISSLQPDFDGVLQLGFHARKEPSAADVWDNHHATVTASQNLNVRLVPLPFERFLGGTFGYVISARQAQCFLGVLGSRNDTSSSSSSSNTSSSDSFDGRFGGATFAVDHFMRAHTEPRHWWATEPRIVHAEFAYASSGAVDSDVASGA